MNTFNMIAAATAAKAFGLNAAFATGTVAPEILNAKNTILSIIYLGAVIIVGGRVLNVLAKGKTVALIGFAVLGGVGLLFINKPELLMTFVAWAINSLAGHTVIQ